MAIATEDQQAICSAAPVSTMATQQGSKKRRSRSNKKTQNQPKTPLAAPACGNWSDSSSSLSSSTSSSSSSERAPPAKKKTNRRRGRKSSKATKNNNNNNQATGCDVSDEEKRKYVAIDAEMVGTGPDGLHSTLARVTIVDWHGDILLDRYVKPSVPVTDYRTFVSGITAQHLEHAGNLADCRAEVDAILQDRILVGHGLKNDMAVLGLRHPWYLTRDTAKWEPFMKVRFDDGILWPRKLKELCQEKLKREIQVAGKAHCPVEDAVAAMDLYKLVRTKWEKAMVYKINKTKEIMEQQQKQHQQ